MDHSLQARSRDVASVREFDGTGSLRSAEDMRRALDEDGIFVVRNALSRDEIGELRDILLRYLPRRGMRFSLGKTQPNAAEKVPDLAFIFAHPRILTVL